MIFTPKSIKGASDPKYENRACYAVKPTVDYNMKSLNLHYLMQANEYLNGNDFIDRKSFFIKLSGTDQLYKQIVSGTSEEDIRKSWEAGLMKFNRIRAHYVMYN